MKTIELKLSKIANAKRPALLRVIPEDIKSADPKNPQNCVIACAARRQFGAEDVRIHLSRVYIRRGNRWLRYLTGTALRSEIIAYDRGGSFSPGDYYLAAITPSRTIGRQQGTTTNQTSSGGFGKSRRPYHFVDDVRPGVFEELKTVAGTSERLMK